MRKTQLLLPSELSGIEKNVETPAKTSDYRGTTDWKNI